MKNLSFVTFILFFLTLAACDTKSTAVVESTPGAREIPVLTDVAGIFKGDMPCADCDKEIVTLRFLMDKTVFKTAAQVNGAGSTAKIGTWDLDGSEVILKFGGDNESYELKGKELLKFLEGKTYSLKKIED